MFCNILASDILQMVSQVIELYPNLEQNKFQETIGLLGKLDKKSIELTCLQYLFLSTFWRRFYLIGDAKEDAVIDDLANQWQLGTCTKLSLWDIWCRNVRTSQEFRKRISC